MIPKVICIGVIGSGLILCSEYWVNTGHLKHIAVWATLIVRCSCYKKFTHFIGCTHDTLFEGPKCSSMGSPAVRGLSVKLSPNPCSHSSLVRWIPALSAGGSPTCACKIFECTHLKFTVSGQSKQRNESTSIHARAQCSPASAGLGQAPSTLYYINISGTSLIQTPLGTKLCTESVMMVISYK